jgi:hypothetical protein
VVKVNPFLGDPEPTENLALSGEILLFGRATRVPIRIPAASPACGSRRVPVADSFAGLASDESVSVIAALTATTSESASRHQAPPAIRRAAGSQDHRCPATNAARTLLSR